MQNLFIVSNRIRKRALGDFDRDLNNVFGKLFDVWDGNTEMELRGKKIDIEWCFIYMMYDAIHNCGGVIGAKEVMDSILESLQEKDLIEYEKISRRMAKLIERYADRGEMSNLIENAIVSDNNNRLDNMICMSLACALMGLIKDGNGKNGVRVNRLWITAFGARALYWLYETKLEIKGKRKRKEAKIENINDICNLLVCIWVFRQKDKLEMQKVRVDHQILFKLDADKIEEQFVDEELMEKIGCLFGTGYEEDERFEEIQEWLDNKDEMVDSIVKYSKSSVDNLARHSYTSLLDLLSYFLAQEKYIEQEDEKNNRLINENTAEKREAERTLRSVRKGAKKLENKVKSMEHLVKEKDKKISKLSEDLHSMGTVKELKEEVKRLEEDNKKYIAKNKGLEVRQKSLEDKIKEKDEELEESNSKVRDLETEIEVYKKMLEADMRDLDESGGELCSEVIDKVAKLRIAVIGGPKGFNRTIKKMLPNSEVIIDGDDKVGDINIPDRFDYVAIYHRIIAHTYVMKAESIAKAKNMRTIYIANTNVNKLYESIYNSIYGESTM